jgi:antitoxin HigA-1
MARLRNIHPGEVLEEEFLKPLGISQYRLAKETHLPQTRISEIVKCRRGITSDTAFRFDKFFGTSPQFWLGLQMDYDLEEEKKRLHNNVVFFSCFVYDDGKTLIGRSWLMEPGEVEDRADRKKGRRVRLPVEQFQEIAKSNGVGELFDYFYDELFSVSLKTQTTKSTIRFVINVEGGKKVFLSIHPKESSSGTGLKTDVRPERIATAFSVDITRLKDALPGPGEQMEGLYGELHYFKTIEEIKKFMRVLKGANL